MIHVVRKLYWDFEKEEQWLNEMSAKGMALTHYSWRKYTFAETANREYLYRIELLDYVPTHPESIAYIRFLEESGIECFCTYGRWIYLRKKSSEGAFDLYTDLKSRIKHYKRIHTLWVSIMWLEFIIGLANILIGGLTYYFSSTDFSIMNIISGGMLIVLGFVFLRAGAPIRKRIIELQQENLIRE